MSKVRYIAERTVFTAILIFAVASALFFFFRLMPGDFIDYLAQSGVSGDAMDDIRAKWGLDDPLYVQYFAYVSNTLTGDMGESFVYGIPVWELTAGRIFNSLILVAPAITLAYVLGGALGGYLGTNRGSTTEKYGIVFASVPRSFPEFFIGIVLVTIFAGMLGLFPTTGMLSIELQREIADETMPLWILLTADFWSHYLLPFTTILLYYLTIPTLVMRTSVVETSGQDFLYYHRITGLSKYTRLKQLIKHSSLPVITLFPISMTRAIGGMVLVEVVFNWPGIGNLLVESVLARDFPVIQFVFLLAAIWVIVGNYLIDILYGMIDPRIAIDGADEA